MSSFPIIPGHFQAEIEIFPIGKSPRKSPAFNGIRWAFVYADEFDELGLDGNTYRGLYSDVFPEFLGSDGRRSPLKTPLAGKLSAIMHVLFPHMVEVHFKRLEVGTRFYCMEGLKPCAEGIVTKLTI